MINKDIKKILTGYKDFYNKNYLLNSEEYKKLQNRQEPKALVIGCSDSRVDPHFITNSRLGDIFVIRNVANLVPPYEPTSGGLHGVSAALEFGVLGLNIKNIIVLGHSGCAGIKRLMSLDNVDDKKTNFVDNWVGVALPAKKKVASRKDISSKRKTEMCEKEAILVSLKNLELFPWIKERIEKDEMFIHGWYFSIKTGKLEIFNKEKNEFIPFL